MQPDLHGLAVDIDETLAWTIGHWVAELQREFGNPENLSVEQMVAKYRYTQNVPYWQTPEALAWMEANRNSNEVQTKLAVIKDADVYLRKIATIVPLSAYITTRPETVLEGTRDWLREHDFPELPIICRPADIPTEDGNAWKARLLKELYPRVNGIIDDNPGVVRLLSPDYKGTVFFYDADTTESTLRVIPCADWRAVYEAVKLNAVVLKK